MDRIVDFFIGLYAFASSENGLVVGMVLILLAGYIHSSARADKYCSWKRVRTRSRLDSYQCRRCGSHRSAAARGRVVCAA